MKLRKAIDTVISHNALVSLDMRDNDDPNYSNSVYSGMAHEIPEELLEYEFYPITDVIDSEHRLHIELKECDDDNDSENNSDINMIPVYIGERTIYINNDDLPVW